MRRRPLHLSYEQFVQTESCRRVERRTTVAAIVGGGFMVALMITRVALAYMEGRL